jgi:hypothetical protein
LSQDTIAILQQFESRGIVTEQQAYAPRYPLQDNLSLHFADADIANRARNEKLFNEIDEALNSDAIEEFIEKMKLNLVRRYLQRKPRRISPPSTKSSVLLEMQALLSAIYR